MSEFINKKYPTFCILPFTRTASTNDGNYRVCCYSEENNIPNSENKPCNMRTDDIKDVWNNDYYVNLRNDLLNGVKNPACSYCWDYESRGTYSHRQKALTDASKLYPNLLEFIEDSEKNNGKLSTMPLDMDLKIGTQCNLKCIMCYPGSSSLHTDEHIEILELGLEPPKMPMFFTKKVDDIRTQMDVFNPKNFDIDKLVSNLDSSLSVLKHLSIVGGEPLVNKTSTKIIEYCVDKDYAKDMALQIITNLSVINNKTLDLLDKFKHPMLNISYDHIDSDKFNFIRYPADYAVLTNNLERLKQYPHIEKKYSTTWGIFNIFDMESIFSEWERQSIEYKDKLTINFGLIYYPNYFNMSYLEHEQKLEINNIIDTVLKNDYKIFRENSELVKQVLGIKDFIKDTPDDFIEVVRERTRVLRLYDKIRNTNYKSLYPYLVDYE